MYFIINFLSFLAVNVGLTKLYSVIKPAVTFSEAAQICYDNNMRLAKVETNEDVRSLQSALQTMSIDEAWTALMKNKSFTNTIEKSCPYYSTNSEILANLKWSVGNKAVTMNPFSFNFDECDLCIRFRTHGASMSDRSCSEKYNTACETSKKL